MKQKTTNVNHRKVESVAKASSDILSDQIEQLAGLFPEAITEGKVDFEKLRAVLGTVADDGKERYSFSWAGKRDALRLLQTPSRATLLPCPKESINFDETNNVFVEGDNLEVLKLLYKSYFGRVKMIYIDPPYNTGNDFIYPDNFADPLDSYLKLTGQKDVEGNLLTSNPETGGRYHSAWLSMMYPRLFIARQLLRDDGIILVSIDDHELHNLRLLMNQIFGEESFLATFIWHRRQRADSRNQDRASTDHEYIVAYRNPRGILRGKDIDTDKYSNPDNDPLGPWFSADLTGLATKERRPNLHYDVVNPKTGLVYPPSPTRGWSCAKATFQKHIELGRIIWPAKPDGRPRLKKYLKEVTNFQTGFSSILEIGFTTEGTREIQDLFGEKVFQFPKPVDLIKTFVHQTTSGSDVIVDFFAGSCTTAQAILEMNREDGGSRRVILVQLPEPIESKHFSTIADIGKERIRRVVKKLQKDEEGKLALKSRKEPEDLGFKVFKLAESNYKLWTGVQERDAQTYLKTMDHFTDPLTPGWKPDGLIWEVAIKEGYGLNSKIEKITGLKNIIVYKVTDQDKGQSFRICLDNAVKTDTLKALSLSKDDLFICRDAALDDEAAANLALQCRLKTI